MKQFEIWWADLPKPAGRQPVLLLTRNSGYVYLTKVIAAEIASTVRDIASEVRLGPAEGLPRECVANCDSLRIVAKTSLTGRAGRLDPKRWIEVKRAVGAALGWRELTDLD
ncbi:Transcriptional modulator of MazE/toxin, MazF [Candidatus Sulfopaludibacter sp. SbA4]|nr:Transcriptional modulator of MazE/toxin, MazF [Candidatus Sulfopaludibacter sp. SbA4]